MAETRSVVGEVTADDVETYQRDGVVLLRQMFSPEWIELLNAGLDVNLARPTDNARIWDRDAAGRTMFWDNQAWLGIDEYRTFVFQSPAADIAAALMGSTEINFFFDAVFVRSAGSQFETPWHQDEPYWSVDGYDTCTIWMPLVPVAKKNSLAFVPGTHRNKSVFHQFNFGELNPDEKDRVDQVDFSPVADTSLPDINADPDAHGVVSWAMEPGDCVVFNGRTLHGGSGRLDSEVELRVFTSKWLGDDVRIMFREHGMDPDHSEIMTRYGLQPGDRPGTDLCPRITRLGS